MNIIDSIEINYFRSLYQAKLKSVDKYNVLVGSNDSGKSNILRALNLFFNSSVSDVDDFSFLDDVTHSRQDEARDAKGRLTIWIRVTFRNYENWKTLPDKFSVKKVWNRYSEFPEVTYDAENQASVTKFLNKIKFNYVPAVKTAGTYAFYLRELYDILSRKQDIDLVAPARVLSETVNGAVVTMSNRIMAATSVDSTINIPTNFKDIFEKLNFSTRVGEYFVPLERRGDGVQARHIPHILEYISENNGKSNIWAYEEPENSLELSNAFELAEQFVSDFALKSQIFVTSHSPAFYGVEGDGVAKFFVEKVDYNGTNISKISKLEDVNKADGSLGISRLIAQRSESLFEELRALKSANTKLSRLERPAIVTEGVTDVEILREAQRRILGSESFFEVFCCENEDGKGGGHSNLRSVLECTPSKEQFKRVGIFDRDNAGIQSFSNLRNFNNYPGDLNTKVRGCGKIFAMILPDRDWDDPYFELAGRSIAIEQMFSPEVIGRDIIKYKFNSANGTLSKAAADDIIKSVGREVAASIIKTQIEIVDKNLAAKRIKKAKDKEFDAFEALFKSIKTLV